MAEPLRPTDADQLREAVAGALADGTSLEVVGAGSKRGLGRPVAADRVLDLSALVGIDLYEPNELVMTAKAATPLAEIGRELKASQQRLLFEPPDLGPLFGRPAGQGTIGGLVACNLAGPRRIQVGAARDHFLGFHAVSGRGETFKSGGRVVKNVTGFDLSKLMAGSFGTLAAMSAVTVKVMPLPERTRTVVVVGASDSDAVAALSRALGSPHEISGAAHLPAAVAARSAVGPVAAAGAAVTALRLEGPEPSVAARAAALRDLLAPVGVVDEIGEADSTALWAELRDVAPFAAAQDRQVWKLSVPPAEGARAVAAITAAVDAEAYYDWGGGLVWLAMASRDDAGCDIVRAAVGVGGGHAMLVRAADAVRAAVPVFQPQPAALAAVAGRVKAAFDPEGILNPGRMAG